MAEAGTIRAGRGRMHPLAVVVIVVFALVLLACAPVAPSRDAGSRPSPIPTPRIVAGAPGIDGDPRVGRALFGSAGCAGCHTVNTVPAAQGVAGPNLTNVVLRPTLAGEVIPMSPETLSAFLLNPSLVKPGSTMPNVGLSPDEARDLTAYLYSVPYRRP